MELKWEHMIQEGWQDIVWALALSDQGRWHNSYKSKGVQQVNPKGTTTSTIEVAAIIDPPVSSIQQINKNQMSLWQLHRQHTRTV